MGRAQLVAVIGALAAPAVAISACGDQSGVAQAQSTPAGTGGSSSFEDAGADTDAPSDGARLDGDGPVPTRVLVGINATPATSDDAGPSAADQFEAQLSVIAAGARAAVVSRRWRDIAMDPTELADETGVYVRYGLTTALELAVVDRAFDGRPDGLAGLAWDDPATLAAIDATLDAVATAVPSVRYLVLGRETDMYATLHPAEMSALTAFVAHAIAHVQASGGPELHIAVGVALDGVTGGSAPADEMRALGDRLAVSYFPGLEVGVAAPVSGMPAAIDALVAKANGEPILLTSIAYPTDMGAGSDTSAQRLFYETLWSEIAVRRQAFELVNVFALHDLSPAACSALAIEQGHGGGDGFSAFYCSTGLRTIADVAKPAWAEALVGTSMFASP